MSRYDVTAPTPVQTVQPTQTQAPSFGAAPEYPPDSFEKSSDSSAPAIGAGAGAVAGGLGGFYLLTKPLANMLGAKKSEAAAATSTGSTDKPAISAEHKKEIDALEAKLAEANKNGAAISPEDQKVIDGLKASLEAEKARLGTIGTPKTAEEKAKRYEEIVIPKKIAKDAVDKQLAAATTAKNNHVKFQKVSIAQYNRVAGKEISSAAEAEEELLTPLNKDTNRAHLEAATKLKDADTAYAAVSTKKTPLGQANKELAEVKANLDNYKQKDGIPIRDKDGNLVLTEAAKKTLEEKSIAVEKAQDEYDKAVKKHGSFETVEKAQKEAQTALEKVRTKIIVADAEWTEHAMLYHPATHIKQSHVDLLQPIIADEKAIAELTKQIGTKKVDEVKNGEVITTTGVKGSGLELDAQEAEASHKNAVNSINENPEIATKGTSAEIDRLNEEIKTKTAAATPKANPEADRLTQEIKTKTAAAETAAAEAAEAAKNAAPEAGQKAGQVAEEVEATLGHKAGAAAIGALILGTVGYFIGKAVSGEKKPAPAPEQA